MEQIFVIFTQTNFTNLTLLCWSFLFGWRFFYCTNCFFFPTIIVKATISINITGLNREKVGRNHGCITGVGPREGDNGKEVLL